MNGSRKLMVALATAGLLTSGVAQAALVDRGGGLIYDTALDVTWLANVNYAASNLTDAKVAAVLGQNFAWSANGATYTHTLSTLDFKKSGSTYTGAMTWWGAQTWVAGLTYFDSVRNVTYDDWRLPTLNPLDTSCSSPFTFGTGNPTYYQGSNCTGGELSHLLVTDLGTKPNQSVLNAIGDTSVQNANKLLFSNLLGSVYWSDASFTPLPTQLSWAFDASLRGQGLDLQGSQYFAWAVRDGDVASGQQQQQAVPEPMSAALLGLGLAGLAASRRRMHK